MTSKNYGSVRTSPAWTAAERHRHRGRRQDAQARIETDAYCAHTTKEKRGNTTTRCNSCMLLLQERQRQEKELCKSNVAHIVCLSATSVAHPYGQDHETKTAQKVHREADEKTKPCMSCGDSFPKQGHFSDRMWMQKDSIRKCDSCVAATARNAQNQTKPCASCNKSFPKEGHFTYRMWKQKDELRKCDGCVNALGRTCGQNNPKYKK